MTTPSPSINIQLAQALNEKDIFKVRDALKEGASFHALKTPIVNNFRDPLACVLARQSSGEIMRLALDHGVDPLKATLVGMNALQEAAEVGNLGTLAAILDRGIDPDTMGVSPCGNSCSALAGAALRLKPDCMRLLIDAGADPNKSGTFGCPLGAAIAGPKDPSKQLECVNILLDAGAFPEFPQDYDGEESPIVLALKNGLWEVADALFQKGACPVGTTHAAKYPYHGVSVDPNIVSKYTYIEEEWQRNALVG